MRTINLNQYQNCYPAFFSGRIRLATVFRAVMIIALLFSGPATFAQQNVKTTLFKDVDEKFQLAKKVKAEVLAPKSYGEAMKLYQKANSDYEKGKNLADIRKKLNGAVAYLTRAIEATRLAEVTLGPAIKARAAAMKAKAPSTSTDLWNRAEMKFAEASGKLEDGDVNGAKKRAGEAERLHRDAELDAIKNYYLKGTWDLLAKADKLDVEDTAPRTLARAQELIRKAESELTNNRYDTDVARSLALQANYEARHALYLHQTVEAIKKQKRSFEDIILMSEVPLTQLASSIDAVAEFDNGYNETTREILEYIRTYQDSVSQLNNRLSDLDDQVVNGNERIAELESQLGDFARQKSDLQKKIDAQARVRAQFQQVEKMFSREEARVLREGSDIIMRLVGLNFQSGKAVIEPSYFSLLTRVQDAIKTFPGSKIIIEGHTDSYGGDELNLKLSEERAIAVRQYMLANLPQAIANSIEAVGFGENQPIANNETAEGRAKNRRIDIIIQPQLLGVAE